MADQTNNKFNLSFSIGPVQGFVAQARRTRDLWCGSWLLSYLSETALAAAENSGGMAIIPFRTDEDRGNVTAVHSSIGGIPNRFELTFDSAEQARSAGETAVNALQTAWQKIAEAVWNNVMVAAAERGNGTEEIWRRQVDNFWECNWVVASPPTGQQTISSLTSARKQLRNVSTTIEPGVKCSLMNTLQELSGHLRRKQQDEFWDRVRSKTGSLNISKSERLSAIGLIKRTLPNVSQDVLGIDLNSSSWPSTTFVAATPWLLALNDTNPSGGHEFKSFLKNAGCEEGDHASAKSINVPWASMDSHSWFKSSLQQNEWQLDEDELADVAEMLGELYRSVGDRKPIPYYAMLMMDGDSLGKLLGRLGEPGKLSQCLRQFTDSVDAIVARKPRYGRTIYAGGDDVLAMLPAEHAIPVAVELSQLYQSCFGGTNAADIATISGAVVFAHHHYPMRQVIKTAHELLDNAAKESTGRDALAVGIIQGSGLNALWSAPWGMVQENASDPTSSDSLMDLIPRFSSREKDDDSVPNYNASFLYHLRTQFSRLFANPLELPGSFGSLPHHVDTGNSLLANLANSELRRRMSKADQAARSPSDTLEIIKPLISLSQRSVNVDRKIQTDESTFGFDGWRVARFLSKVSEGKVNDHE